MRTIWTCRECGKSDSFTHAGLTGVELINEVRVYHDIANHRLGKSCRFWDLKIKIRTVKA